MRLAATNLSLPFNADESALMMLLASELRVKQEDIQSLRITRHSLDARDKADIRSIYSVSFELSTENAKRVAFWVLKTSESFPNVPSANGAGYCSAGCARCCCRTRPCRSFCSA